MSQETFQLILQMFTSGFVAISTIYAFKNHVLGQKNAATIKNVQTIVNGKNDALANALAAEVAKTTALTAVLSKLPPQLAPKENR